MIVTQKAPRALFNLFVIVIAAVFAGCLSSEGEGTDSPGPGPGGNNAPSISGTPSSSAAVGVNYSFTPNASDADGDPLTFSVENLPAWASFDASNGTLSGMPTLGNVGTYSNIRISVSDGSASASLPSFGVTVSQGGNGSVTLNWTAPTENTDGSPLMDLAGFNIYYGSSPGSYPNKIHISNPSVTTFVVENLIPNTYYFVATSQNGTGIESPYSNEVIRTVN